MKENSAQQNLSELQKYTQLPPATLAKATTRNPILLKLSPKTIYSNLTRLSRTLGIGHADLLKAFVRQPTILCRRPEKLVANFEALTLLFEIPPNDLRQAIIRQPQILLNKPFGIFTNAKNSAIALDVSWDDFLLAALRNPSLFYQNPSLLRSKAPYLRRLSHRLGQPYQPSAVLRSLPAAYCYSKNYLFARYLLVRWNLCQSRSLSSILTLPWRDVRTLLTTFVSKLPNENRESLLLSLKKRDILSSSKEATEAAKPPSELFPQIARF